MGADLRETGLAHYVTKPITRASLLKAILKVLGQRRENAEIIPSGTPAVRLLSILLVEDNLVNQKVATRLLARLGHSVVVASDGVKALEVFTHDAFDLILMDVQMPIMGGYEATRSIREREQGTGRRVPIVALTAHAMKGDRELCLEA
jgi:two-component system, sensor histidine kinase and response regulator